MSTEGEASTGSALAVTAASANANATLPQLLAIKQQWEAHLAQADAALVAASAADAAAGLRQLWADRAAMTTTLLRDSGIGRVLTKLRRRVAGEDANLAAQLLDAWKATANATVAAAATASGAAAATTTPATPTPVVGTATAAVTVAAPAPASPAPTKVEDADSLSRKRKAPEAASSTSPASGATKRVGLAQSTLVGMEYPVPVRAASTPQVTLPSSDAFFAKPSPAARAPARSAVASTRPLPATPRPSTTDEFRSTIRLQLCRCFPTAAGANSTTAAESEYASEVVEVATEIEAMLFHLNKGDVGAPYRTKSREVLMNLRDPKNPELRQRVLSADISVHALLTLPFTELASAALKSEREAAIAWEMKERRSDVSAHVTITDAWRCGKCRERKCSYYQMQTRSADEPMTTFALGIPRLLDVEDLLVDKPDERSVMTQVAEYFHRFAVQETKEVAARRAAKFLQFTKNMNQLKFDYEQTAKQLLEWVQDTIARFGSVDFGATLEDSRCSVSVHVSPASTR